MTFPAAARDGAPTPMLSGRLRRSRGQATGAVVLCHPHPVFGGHMDVWLLPRIGEVLAEAGWTVLRFDFRSAHTRSDVTVEQTDGAIETADLQGALDLLDEVVPEPRRRAVVGWSFGALVGVLHGLADPRITDWVGIAPPTRPIPGVPLVPVPSSEIPGWTARRTVIVGSHDQHFPPDTVMAVHPHAVRIVDGADHFFFDRDDEVAALVRQALV